MTWGVSHSETVEEFAHGSSLICARGLFVRTVQYSVSRHFFTLMASLARPFPWKPGCHGNTACLLELEMSFSIPHLALLRVSFLYFFLPSPPLPHLWQASCCQSKSPARFKATCATNGGKGWKTGRHLCFPREKWRGRVGICFGNWGDLVLNQKQHIGIGRKCWMTFKR